MRDGGAIVQKLLDEEPLVDPTLFARNRLLLTSAPLEVGSYDFRSWASRR